MTTSLGSPIATIWYVTCSTGTLNVGNQSALRSVIPGTVRYVDRADHRQRGGTSAFQYRTPEVAVEST